MIETIDLDKAFEKKTPINIDDISVNYEYIMLETTDKSLIDDNPTIYSDETYLIAIARHQILLFDRETGKFIREIAKSGNGPDEYTITYKSVPFNEQSKVIYAARGHQRNEYGLNGQLLNTKKGPEPVIDFVNLNDSIYASFIENFNGDEKRKIVIFKNTDSIIRVFSNYQSFSFKNNWIIYYPESWFYTVNKQIHFCEKFNDTVFTVTSTSLTPEYVLNKGVHSFPYVLRGNYMEIAEKYFITQNVMESARFLLYSFSFEKKLYTALYDKKHKRTIVNDYSGDWGNGTGCINNINDFVPLELSSINNEGELICTMDAYKIKLWFETNPDKFDLLPESLKNMGSIKDTENPVVVISKLKD